MASIYTHTYIYLFKTDFETKRAPHEDQKPYNGKRYPEKKESFFPGEKKPLKTKTERVSSTKDRYKNNRIN